MPILPHDDILTLLREGAISALTFDTNVFDEKGLQLNSPPLSTVAVLRGRRFDFILSGTVAKEVQAHIEKATEESVRGARKAIGVALHSFETQAPTRDELIQLITGDRTSTVAAKERFDNYIEKSGCEILQDENLVSTKDLFERYFKFLPPFGIGKKKSEFPDALALSALEATARARGNGIIVVSRDGDWRNFCEESSYLYLVPEIEVALDLLNDPPVLVRQTVLSWLREGSDGRGKILSELLPKIEDFDVDVNGNPSSGEMEATPYGAELENLNWPDETDIDIIDTVQSEVDGTVTATISMPLELLLRVQIDLDFSVWDSVDHESIGLGGRSIECEEALSSRATVVVTILEQGRTIEMVSCDLDVDSLTIELGDVDIFSPEDMEG